jgi:hypothetical protein
MTDGIGTKESVGLMWDRVLIRRRRDRSLKETYWRKKHIRETER